MASIKIYNRPEGDKTKKVLTKHVRPKQHNFLKYWRVVRYWAQRKYGLSNYEIEMLLYLYDKPLFTRKDFLQFEGLLAWDKTRFKELQNNGMIVVWREHKGYSRQAKMYELSNLSKRICASIYKKLTQEEHISELPQNNPVFKGNNYADKMYRKLMKQMNAERDSK